MTNLIVHSHREIAAALALGIKRHLMGTYECIGTVAFTTMIYRRRNLGDDIIDGNRWLLKMVKAQETKVSSLQDHAWLAIHTYDI